MKKLLFSAFLLFWCSPALFSQGSNNALNFQNNNYVNIDNIAPDVANLNSFTIEFWVRFDEQDNTDYNTFYGVNTNNYDNRMVIRVSGSIDGTTGTVVVLMKNTSKKYLIGQINVGDNKCHHVAFTYDNEVCKLYIDGQLDVSTNNYFEFQPSDLHSLGQEYDQTPIPTSAFYNGELDEFRIWNFAKSQTEIQNNKDTELTGNEIGLLEYFDFNQGTANGNNTSITTLDNKANSTNKGTLNNFNLTGYSSNFVSDKCRISTTGLEEYQPLNQIVISPNPTNGIININKPGTLAHINIKNTLGQIVLQPEPNCVINISSLPSSCYFMQIVDNNGNSKTIKLIRK